MATDLYINGCKVRLKPAQMIGKGGEADVFNIGSGTVLKRFKPADHPDYAGMPQAQQAARDRLQLYQKKLRLFPQNLPDRVIAPQTLATDKSGQTILGYTMPLVKDADVLLKYGDRSFRQSGIQAQTVVQIFQDLHQTVGQLHQQGVVIGDFNDLNVLVKDAKAFLIDADSFQFGAFLCSVFTARFADPLLCDPNGEQPNLIQPHTPDSDWYAFAILVMQGLLLVNPYGGVYKPKDVRQQVPHAARSLHRITVFHPEVRYPKPAIHYSVLPDDLLHYFHRVFEQDQRGEFPRSLLDQLRWTKCVNCGIEHCRSTCPSCVKSQPVSVLVKGAIAATKLFQTEGIILCATVERNHLYWLYHDREQFMREDGSVVLKGNLNPGLRWQIQGAATLLGYQGQMLKFAASGTPERTAVDSRGTTALFQVNPSACFWVHQGQLQQRSQTAAGSLMAEASTFIGDVLSGQTYFWVGPRFGLGFYRAGDFQVSFVFDTQKPGINDRVKLPTWHGQLIDATCTFSADYGWLFLTTQDQGQIYDYCAVIRPDGTVAGTAQVRQDADSWLAWLGRGRSRSHTCPYCAMGNFLLAATDEGIIRVELQNGQLVQTKAFPDTEPYVDSHSQLLAGADGLYVVNPHILYRLQLV